jgi:hypothetical protein
VIVQGCVADAGKTLEKGEEEGDDDEKEDGKQKPIKL